MRFSRDFIEKVRESINIVDVIGQQIQLKKAGINRLVGLCPFHGEKTPSFSVSEDKQMYYCFGCKRAGNVFTFVQENQGLSFPETVEMLAQRAGIPIPEDAKYAPQSADETDQRKEREKLYYRINQFASQFFQMQLQNQKPNSEIKQYLLNRGLKEETITKFQLGFAQDEWEDLSGAFLRKNVPLVAAEQLGLIRKRGEGKSGHYDIFRHRLIFPIVSTAGHVIGFGGRIIGDGQPKYLNSPESEVFHKGKVFYGLHESAKHIRVEDRVIIVEGYMDFLGLYQAGVKPVVATLGTALTPDHAKVLKRLTKNIIVLFDGDEAGQEAAERSLPLLLQEGLIPKGLTLPDEQDPDEFVLRYGLEALEKRMAQAPELFVMILEKSLKGYRGSSGEKVQIIDRFGPYLRACADLRLRDLYMAELSERLAVDFEWVQKALIATPKANEPIRPQNVSQRQEAAPAPVARAPERLQSKIKLVKPPRSELFLLNVSLMKDKYYQLVKGSGVLEQITHEGVKAVFERLEQLYRQMPNKFDSLSASLVVDVEPSSMLGLHLQPPLADLTEEGAEKLVADCSKKIKEAFLRNQLRKMRANLKGQDAKEQLEQLEQIMNINKNRHSLNRES